ncbi:MAG TPA: hypothetical protein VH985_08080 [Candidatus Binatia bacterium]|jgi:hypothetical protein
MDRVEPQLFPSREKAALAAVAQAVSSQAPPPRPAAVAHPAPAPAAPPQEAQLIQLRLRRSQRTAGLISSKVLFAVDARADLTPHARALAQKYRLGPLVVYDSQARTKYNEMASSHLLASNGAPSMGRHLSGLARGLASAAVAAMTLRITVDSLQSGHHIECKDLNELVGAEDAIVEACENIKTYLQVAETFDGREQVIGF